MIEIEQSIVLSAQHHTVAEPIFTNLLRKRLSKEKFFTIMSQVLYTDLFESYEAKAYFLYIAAKLFAKYTDVKLDFDGINTP
ncbi:MAG: hypothetical protein RR370_02530 [Synergistaceae bacterium]